MLTRGDDYPLHQTPEPVAFAGTDRNFYDRYFFNGYSKDDGESFFAAALGVYPALNVMDASFCVIHDGVQHNLHASRVMGMERLDTSVGPIRIDVVEPLECLRVAVNDPDTGISAELTFRARCRPYKEPRFTYRHGARTVLDYTRLTQNGTYTGWIEIEGARIAVSPDRFSGTRDRSWGIRPVGTPDPQPVAPVVAPQFYWLWSPVNFEDACTYYALNDSAEGRPWHHSAAVLSTSGEPEIAFTARRPEVVFKRSTRHAERCVLHFESSVREEWRIELVPKFNFYMSGLGYMNPVWGHGMYHGELAIGYDSWKVDEVDEAALPFLHVQAFCEATLEHGGRTRRGSGVLEQLIMGPHAPSGFKDFLGGNEPAGEK